MLSGTQFFGANHKLAYPSSDQCGSLSTPTLSRYWASKCLGIWSRGSETSQRNYYYSAFAPIIPQGVLLTFGWEAGAAEHYLREANTTVSTFCSMYGECRSNACHGRVSHNNLKEGTVLLSSEHCRFLYVQTSTEHISSFLAAKGIYANFLLKTLTI